MCLAHKETWSTHGVVRAFFSLGTWDTCTETACQSYRIKSTHSSTKCNIWFVLFVTRQPYIPVWHLPNNITAIQALYHRKWVVYKLHDTGSVKQPAPKPCCLLLVPSPECLQRHTIHSSHGVLGQKPIADYDGGAINQSIPPTSTMSADSEISGLTGHFLEQPMPAAPLQIYHRHRISSCTHLSLCWKLKVPLCDLKVHVPSGLVSEFGTTQLHIIINWNDCTAVHKPDACDEEIGLAISK